MSTQYILNVIAALLDFNSSHSLQTNWADRNKNLETNIIPVVDLGWYWCWGIHRASWTSRKDCEILPSRSNYINLFACCFGACAASHIFKPVRTRLFSYRVSLEQPEKMGNQELKEQPWVDIYFSLAWRSLEGVSSCFSIDFVFF